MNLLLNKDKKLPAVPLSERATDSSTPERVANEETRKFEENSKRLQELKSLIPKKDKRSN